jgi:hypothetical protein
MDGRARGHRARRRGVEDDAAVCLGAFACAVGVGFRLGVGAGGHIAKSKLRDEARQAGKIEA